MRHYSPNRPDTMTRVAALALLAERAIDPDELQRLNREAFLQRIGIEGTQFDQMVHDLCRELMTYGIRKPSGGFDCGSERIDELLCEIRDPKLRARVTRLMLDVVNRDGLLLTKESALVTRLIERCDLALGGPVAPVKQSGGWQSTFRRLTSYP